MSAPARGVTALRAGRAALVIAAAYSALTFLLPAVGIDPIARLNVLLASSSAFVMSAIGAGVVQSQTILTFRGASVIVTNECNGLGAWLLVVGAMSALPAVPWRWRLFGLTASAIAMSVVNIARIAVLCYLQAAQPTWFRPVHEQIAPMLVVLVASLSVVGWMRGLDYAPQS